MGTETHVLLDQLEEKCMAFEALDNLNTQPSSSFVCGVPASRSIPQCAQAGVSFDTEALGLAECGAERTGGAGHPLPPPAPLQVARKEVHAAASAQSRRGHHSI